MHATPLVKTEEIKYTKADRPSRLKNSKVQEKNPAVAMIADHTACQ